MSALAKLRPAKVRSALRRRWFERMVPRLDLHPMPGLVDVGTGYGGWTIPVDLVTPDWTCWCVGAGGDISFDLALLDRGATVRAFEPAPRYVEHAREQAAGHERFTALQVAISTEDAPLRLQMTHHEGSDSVSSAGLYDTEGAHLEVPGRTLASLQAEYGDAAVELLKLDIEGAEYEVMREVDLRALGVQVFSTQLHHTGSVTDARALVARLADQGYVAVACRPVVKLTFVRRELLSPGA